jgi:hypothetical protein
MRAMSDFQRDWCLQIMDKLSQKPISRPFQQELTREQGLSAKITTFIEHPLDLSIVRDKLEDGGYNTIAEWAKDIRIIWKSVRKLYRKDSPIWAMATDLSTWFEKHYREYPRSQSEQWFIQFSRTRADLEKLVETYPDRRIVPEPQIKPEPKVEMEIEPVAAPTVIEEAPPVAERKLKLIIGDMSKREKPKENEPPKLFDIPASQPPRVRFG